MASLPRDPRLQRQLAQMMALVLGTSYWCPGPQCTGRTRPNLDTGSPPLGPCHHLVGAARSGKGWLAPGWAWCFQHRAQGVHRPWIQFVLWLTLRCHGPPQSTTGAGLPLPTQLGSQPLPLPQASPHLRAFTDGFCLQPLRSGPAIPAA